MVTILTAVAIVLDGESSIDLAVHGIHLSPCRGRHGWVARTLRLHRQADAAENVPEFDAACRLADERSARNMLVHDAHELPIHRDPRPNEGLGVPNGADDGLPLEGRLPQLYRPGSSVSTRTNTQLLLTGDGVRTPVIFTALPPVSFKIAEAPCHLAVVSFPPVGTRAPRLPAFAGTLNDSRACWKHLTDKPSLFY